MTLRRVVVTGMGALTHLYLIIESLNCLLFCAKTKDVKKNKEIMYLNNLAIFLNIRIR